MICIELNNRPNAGIIGVNFNPSLLRRCEEAIGTSIRPEDYKIVAYWVIKTMRRSVLHRPITKYGLRIGAFSLSKLLKTTRGYKLENTNDFFNVKLEEIQFQVRLKNYIDRECWESSLVRYSSILKVVRDLKSSLTSMGNESLGIPGCEFCKVYSGNLGCGECPWGETFGMCDELSDKTPANEWGRILAILESLEDRLEYLKDGISFKVYVNERY